MCKEVLDELGGYVVDYRGETELKVMFCNILVFGVCLYLDVLGRDRAQSKMSCNRQVFGVCLCLDVLGRDRAQGNVL